MVDIPYYRAGNIFRYATRFYNSISIFCGGIMKEKPKRKEKENTEGMTTKEAKERGLI